MNELKKLFDEYEIPYQEDSISLLIDYMNYILKMNEEINLTAIKDPSSFKEKMILDSALILKLTDFKNKKVLDLGTGAGFPGAVIGILSDLDIDLLDSTEKKLKVIESFPKKKFNTIHARAEEYASSHREIYDIITVRAVSHLSIIMELAMPLLKVEGYLVAMKGKEGETELKEASQAFKKLDCEMIKEDVYHLSNGDTRINFLIKKNRSTSMKYPRKYSDIKAKQL